MRYLSKIIFINSASIKYAEINVDGNVHFIGTQGVGKSTLLRALLFFYNANQLKLGIPTGKKSFVDFYLPFQDSYIIYEVERETGSYCVLAFKSQGRVCFRFIDSSYDKKYFIDAESKANETWDKIKLAFGKELSYTKKIDRYDDYRNILYGNSQGIGVDFKKYSLLESKQYQNIPRAIQHVFLNYKVESDFIKDTIIKSLNEEEIKIDLLNYSHYLKNFDIQLSDIKKWVEKTRNGEIIVRKQAEVIAITSAAIKNLNREKQHLATTLAAQLIETKKQTPKIVDKQLKVEIKLGEQFTKIADSDKKYQLKKDKHTAEISIFNSKLKEVKVKNEFYVSKNIELIIEQVANKKEKEVEKENFLKQKEIASAKFTNINQKYEAQINLLVNQLVAFENTRQTAINHHNKELLNTNQQISKTHDALIEDIRNQHAQKLELARVVLEETRSTINKLHIKKAEIKYHIFYKSEIEMANSSIKSFHEIIRVTTNDNKQLHAEIETIKKIWELDKDKVSAVNENKSEKKKEQQKQTIEKIAVIDLKLENNKGSLYEWLNKEYTGWQNNIGKVIDEDNILFRQGLSPQLISTKETSFYGLQLNLEEINKTVKTVADHVEDKNNLIKELEVIQKEIADLATQLFTDTENLKRKNQPKLSKNKESILNNDYAIEQAKNKLAEAELNRDTFIKKANDEKKNALEANEASLQNASELSLKNLQDVTVLQQNIQKQIDTKRKEKEKKISLEQTKVNELLEVWEVKMNDKKVLTNKEITILKNRQKLELDNSGADTARLYEIEEKLLDLQLELEAIENNRDIVTEYNKDKRELFDKTDYFKDQKISVENQLETEEAKYALQKQKMQEDIVILQNLLTDIKIQLSNNNEDLEKYNSFILTDCYKSIKQIIELVDETNYDTPKTERCKVIIDQLNSIYYKAIDRYRELQEAINKFNGNFSAENIFKFKTKLIEQEEYFQFAEDLNEFIEEDKISMYEKRVNELFAEIIKQVGKETSELLSKEGEIQTVITDINKDFVKRNFAGVIKSIQLRVVQSSNKVVHLLTEIKKFNDENLYELGMADLFSSDEHTREVKNKKAIGLLIQFVKEIADYKNSQINLSDSFELEFKIIENDNDTNWVQNLANVGSDGTDVLVKAMINIMLLNVFKEGATKNKFKDFRLHCMMDEIGKLHPTNVRGILKFANDRNIFLINSSPQSFDALAYRYTYKLAKDDKNVTTINKLITNHRDRL